MKKQHVVPHKDGWAVKGGGNKKATKITSTQQAAFNIARKIAINQKTEVVIHNRKGKIRNSNSYGNDPFPPKDKKF